MNWLALAQLLFQLFGPIIAEWLKSLFDKLPDGQSASPVEAIGDWFAAARARTWRWQLGKRARLAVLEQVARRRAPDLALAAAVPGSTPKLTADDARDIAGAM